MLRLHLRMPRPVKSLNEVKTILSHFEQYGRLREFVLHKDFFTRERSGTGALSYADESVAIDLLKKKKQVLYFPPPTPRQQSTSQSASKDSRNGNLSGSRDRSVDKQEEFVIVIQKSKDTLQEVIERRANKMLRTNDVTQSRINQHMLKGFEGYYGELSKLWDRIGRSARERSVRMIALDRLRNERGPRNGSGIPEEKRAKRKERDGSGIAGEGERMQMDGERDGKGWTDAGGDFRGGNEGDVKTGEVEKGVKVEGVEERLEMTAKALNNLRLEVGGDTSIHPVEDEKT